MAVSHSEQSKLGILGHFYSDSGMLSPRTGLGLEAKKTGLGLGLDGNGPGLETLRPRPRVVRPRGLVYCNVLISCSVANDCQFQLNRQYLQEFHNDDNYESIIYVTVKN